MVFRHFCPVRVISNSSPKALKGRSMHGSLSSEDSNHPRILDEVRQYLRLHHYSTHTERSYVDWIVRFIHFSGTYAVSPRAGPAIWRRGFSRQGCCYRPGSGWSRTDDGACVLHDTPLGRPRLPEAEWLMDRRGKCMRRL